MYPVEPSSGADGLTVTLDTNLPETSEQLAFSEGLGIGVLAELSVERLEPGLGDRVRFTCLDQPFGKFAQWRGLT